VEAKDGLIAERNMPSRDSNRKIEERTAGGEKEKPLGRGGNSSERLAIASQSGWTAT